MQGKSMLDEQGVDDIYLKPILRCSRCKSENDLFLVIKLDHPYCMRLLCDDCWTSLEDGQPGQGQEVRDCK